MDAISESSLGTPPGRESATQFENDPHWVDIDHAERCLLSAMYEEAADGARSVLRSLCRVSRSEIGVLPVARSGSLTEGQLPSEIVSMIEAAGMVLLQALSEMGSAGKIFDDMRSMFEFMGKVPYSLVLTGICLQLSSGNDSAAKVALEEYLNCWRFRESNGDMVMVCNGNCSESTSSGEDLHLLYLATSDYVQLTEIYVVEILAKALKDSMAAGLWIQRASISEQDKQALSEKLKGVTESQQRSVSSKKLFSKDRVSVNPTMSACDDFQGTKDDKSSEQESVTLLGVSPATSIASKESNVKAVVKRSGVFQRFPFVRTVLSLVELMVIRLTLSSNYWTTRHRRLPHYKFFLAAGFSSTFGYVLFRRREYWKRMLLEVLMAVKKIFGDLWQLAFSVHLNPLAAVQPQSSLRTS